MVIYHEMLFFFDPQTQQVAFTTINAMRSNNHNKLDLTIKYTLPTVRCPACRTTHPTYPSLTQSTPVKHDIRSMYTHTKSLSHRYFNSAFLNVDCIFTTKYKYTYTIIHKYVYSIYICVFVYIYNVWLGQCKFVALGGCRELEAHHALFWTPYIPLVKVWMGYILLKNIANII